MASDQPSLFEGNTDYLALVDDYNEEINDSQLTVSEADELVEEEVYDYMVVIPNIYQEKYALSGIKLVEGKKLYAQIFKLMHVLNPDSAGVHKKQGVTIHDSKMIAKKLKPKNNMVARWDEFESVIKSKGRDTASAREFLELIYSVMLEELQHQLGTEVDLYYGRDYENIFIRLRMTETNYRVQASLQKYPLKLKREQTEDKQVSHQQFMPYHPYEPKDNGIANFMKNAFIKTDVNVLFCKYDKNERKIKTEAEESNGSLFKYRDRVKLINQVILNLVDVGTLSGCGGIITHYPLHGLRNLQYFKLHFASFLKLIHRLDLKRIRNYFGERIALYFHWLQFYNYWMFLIAVIGLITFILQKVFQYNNMVQAISILLLVYCILMAVGTSFQEQIWHRSQNYDSVRWGTHDMKDDKIQRKQFEGEYCKDVVTGMYIKFDKSPIKTAFKRIFGSIFTLLVVIFACALTLSFSFYDEIYKPLGVDADYIGIINGVEINFMAMVNLTQIYPMIMTKLCNWENYEFQYEYDNAMISRTYAITFVNCYSSIIYNAFFKSYFNGTDIAGTMASLEVTLSQIYITRFVMNFFEIGVPYATMKVLRALRRRRAQRLHEQYPDWDLNITPAESHLLRGEYGTPFADYLEMVSDYGYIVMFSAACPIMPVLSFIGNSLELRVDAWKLIYEHRRPYPSSANSIGAWLSILKTISYIGAVTNVALALYTGHAFSSLTINERWFLFILLEHAIIFVKSIVSGLISPESVAVMKNKMWGRSLVMRKVHAKHGNIHMDMATKKYQFTTAARKLKEVEMRMNIATDDYQD